MIGSSSISGRKLSLIEYADPNPVRCARFLLGKFLMVRTEEGLTGGMICETEAYGGAQDKACHGYGNRRTARTEVMFARGGMAYVYLCYGLHHLFNVVTGDADVPQAVLIRAVKITEGGELAAKRRRGVPEKHWASGPGKVSAALGIDHRHGGHDLTGEIIWIEDRGLAVRAREIQTSARIGVGYAGIWAKKPWRFVWSPLRASKNKLISTCHPKSMDCRFASKLERRRTGLKVRAGYSHHILTT
jgi:DNA-3-methyladenine glycosylase